MARDTPTPAIVRAYCREDADVHTIGMPRDTVSHTRGFGDSGYRVQLVEKECPADHCSFDRMIRRWDVNPEMEDEVRYWCLNPNCAHFVGDSLSYACHGSYPQRGASEPVVFE